MIVFMATEIPREQGKFYPWKDAYTIRYHPGSGNRTETFIMGEFPDGPKVMLRQFQQDKVSHVLNALKAVGVAWGHFDSGCGATVAIIPGVLNQYGATNAVDLRSQGKQEFTTGYFIRGPRISELPTPEDIRKKSKSQGNTPILLVLEALGSSPDVTQHQTEYLTAIRDLIKTCRDRHIPLHCFYTFTIKKDEDAQRMQAFLIPNSTLAQASEVRAKAKPFNREQFEEFVTETYYGRTSSRRVASPLTVRMLTNQAKDDLVEGILDEFRVNQIPPHLKIVRIIADGVRDSLQRGMPHNRENIRLVAHTLLSAHGLAA